MDVSIALQRLKCMDPTLNEIILRGWQHTGRIKEINELFDELIKTPNIVTCLSISCSQLPDKIGIKLAQYLMVSTTIQELIVCDNYFTEITFRAIAAALRFNTSLKVLHLRHNNATYFEEIRLAFVDALVINPNRPIDSCWTLFTYQNIFDQLKGKAEQLGHPNMQSLLATKLIGMELC